MVQNALDVEPPLGLIRTFIVDDDPGVKGTLDLKARGTRLFVDCARVFALALGIADTGTAARLRARRRAPPRRAAARRRDGRGVPVPATAAAAAAGPAARCRATPIAIDPVCAARDRPADAEGGVPAGASTCRSVCGCPIGSNGASARCRTRARCRVGSCYYAAMLRTSGGSVTDDSIYQSRASASSRCSCSACCCSTTRCWRCSTGRAGVRHSAALRLHLRLVGAADRPARAGDRALALACLP